MPHAAEHYGQQSLAMFGGEPDQNAAEEGCAKSRVSVLNSASNCLEAPCSRSMFHFLLHSVLTLGNYVWGLGRFGSFPE